MVTPTRGRKGKTSVRSTQKNKAKTTLRDTPLYEQAFSLLRETTEAKTMDEALKIITNKACALVGGLGGSIWLRSGEERHKAVLRWTFRSHGANKVGESYYTNIMTDDGYYDGLTAWVFGTGRSLLLKDITNEEEIRRYENLKWVDKYGGFKEAADKEKQKHFLAVPIFSCRAKKEVIGVLRIGASKIKKGFNKTHLELLEIYSGYVSGLLTNYLKLTEERALVEKLLTVASQRDLDVLLNETANTIPLVMDGSYCSIFLKDHNGEFALDATNAPQLQKFTRSKTREAYLRYKPGAGKTGRVAAGGETIRVSGDITSLAGFGADLCECGPASAFLAAAIREDRSQKPVGVVRVVRDLEIGEEFDVDDEQFLETFGRLLCRCLTIHGYFSKGTCFVIMPFEEDLEQIYKNIIKPTVEEFDFICRREDEFSAIGVLSAGIISHIANASFIIADITRNNPNVYYELGIAHTLEKLVILMSQIDAPSDIRHWKYINYKNTAGEAKILTNNLRSSIKEAIESGLVKLLHE